MDYVPPRSVQGPKKLHGGTQKGRTNHQSERTMDPVTMAMFPTPSASCQMDVVAPPETVNKNSKGWSVTRVGTGTKFGAKLNDVVNKIEKMYTEQGITKMQHSTDLERNQDQATIVPNSSKEQQTWWQTQSDLCGVPNGVSYELDKNRSNRIKSLGNAIVPQCARILGLAIKKVLIEEGRE